MKQTNVSWVMASDGKTHGSAMRLQTYPAHEELLRRGILSRVIVHDNRDPGPTWEQARRAVAGASVVVLAKIAGELRERYAIEARRAGTRVVLLLSTVRSREQPVELADELVAPYISPREREALMARNAGLKLHLIPDPLEPFLPHPGLCVDAPSERTVLWIGRLRYLDSLRVLRAGLPAGWQLKVLTDAPDVGISWDPLVARRLLGSCQVLAITNDFNVNSSPIRLQNGLASGKPVLAPPVPSYLEHSRPGREQGWSCCITSGDFYAELQRLSSPSQREAERAGALAVARTYSRVRPAEQWVELLSAC